MSAAPTVRSHPLSEGPGPSTQAPSPTKPPAAPTVPVSVDTSPAEISEVIDPHKLPPSRRPEPGVTSAPSLEAASVVDIVGDQGLQRASIMRVSHPSGNPKLSQVSAPADSPTQQRASRSGVRKAWDRLMEITPGTNQHKTAFGARWTLGSYRLGGKR